MTEQAGLVQANGCAASATGRRKVVGKAQLVVSAVGMSIMLGSLCRGHVLEAGVAFLLTIGILEIMFHRALGQFHTASGARATKRPTTSREARRPAAAGE